VLFDKTGTLTAGKPEVVKTWFLPRPITEESAACNPMQPTDASPSPLPKGRGVPLSILSHAPLGNAQSDTAPMLILAASLARHSSHPISQALARVSRPDRDVADWQEIRGSGVQGRAEVRNTSEKAAIQAADSNSLVEVRLGSLPWLAASGADLGQGKAFVAEWAAQGATVVGLAVGHSLEALFAVRDTVKAGAPEVVARLQRQGLQIYLVTGDNSSTATAIGRQLGISSDNVFAEVRPEQKAEFVKRLQARGQRVAFVGDGINDAPALEQADLGVAVSRASDVAREAADIILLNSEIEAVPDALALARATLRTIKQNLFWAFFYNAIGVPLAALGFMSPVLCAAAMGLSDLVVIGNALRLRRVHGGFGRCNS